MIRAPFLVYDLHPRESTVRCFDIPPTGLLRPFPKVVTQTASEGVVLRHYAWSDRWYALNVTVDLDGAPVVTGPVLQYAVNCDIVTPCVAVDGGIATIDLFIDVLVDADLVTYRVVDLDEFDDAVSDGVLGAQEAEGAQRGLRELERFIRSGDLAQLVHDIPAEVARSAPESLPLVRVPRSGVPAFVPR